MAESKEVLTIAFEGAIPEDLPEGLLAYYVRHLVGAWDAYQVRHCNATPGHYRIAFELRQVSRKEIIPECYCDSPRGRPGFYYAAHGNDDFQYFFLMESLGGGSAGYKYVPLFGPYFIAPGADFEDSSAVKWKMLKFVD